MLRRRTNSIESTPIDKTEAIALRIAPFSRTSHVVTWFTCDKGRLVTVVKGACRPKSVFLGQYDLFYTCELLYYSRERSGAYIAKECSPVRLRSELRNDWRAFACASQMADLILRTIQYGDHDPGLYGLVSSTLDFLCANSASTQLLLWFELQVARHAGFSPRLTHCSACNSPIGRDAAGFSAARGGILCPSCVDDWSTESTFLPASALDFLRHMADSDSPRTAVSRTPERDHLERLKPVVGEFLAYHLDTSWPLAGRRIAFEMMERTAAAR